jgi:hypothetical protein
MSYARLTLRARPVDLAHVTTIADALRRRGVRRPTRTAAIQHALAAMAGLMGEAPLPAAKR